MDTLEQFEKLKKYDTPTITNVVATYPGKEYCMGLYDPWKGKWYTDQTLKCMYPGNWTPSRICGYMYLWIAKGRWKKSSFCRCFT